MALPDRKDKDKQNSKIYEEEEGLNGKPREENIIRSFGIFVLGFPSSNKGSTCDLDHCANRICGNKSPEDEFPIQKAALKVHTFILCPYNKFCQAKVYACRDENGSDNDEKVIDHKIYDAVWVVARRQSSEDITNDFHHTGKCEWQEVPSSIE